MARLYIKTAGISPEQIVLAPGCNQVGREGENDILIAHDSVSRRHCEVWLTDDAVLVRDLESRNGTWIDDNRVTEAQLFDGQTLRVGDVELVLAEAPVRISVPELPKFQPKEASYMPDGSLCCWVHDQTVAVYQCSKCQHPFCGVCVRELRVAGSIPRRFCPECGGQCERITRGEEQQKRSSWLDRIKDAFTKPPRRH